MNWFLRYILPYLPVAFTTLTGFVRRKKTERADDKRAKLIEESVEFQTDPKAEPEELEIIQLRDLKKHPSRKWKKRALSEIKLIVLHHTATDNTKSSWGGIANYATTPSPDNHLSAEGAPYIPYHFGIDMAGVYQFNDLDDITWSVLGYNRQSINITILGDFSTEDSHKGKNELQPVHKRLIRLLVLELVKQFPAAGVASATQLRITTHRDLGKYNCPGDSIRTLAQELQKEVISG